MTLLTGIDLSDDDLHTLHLITRQISGGCAGLRTMVNNSTLQEIG
jgi:hypothetical protein